ncbi:helix-turn-helix domain-containing protein [Clostridium tertium]|uniref:helix-turn-helix domain-containing protein n=1 Tax=Clostridium tertium TaxID=1559 RepID=UPI0024B3B6C9|nr:AraC family transcriptional regulator [Clostridium tertium]MDI9218494.1 AraC family transcriptional regulator [Clostridium tertium]
MNLDSAFSIIIKILASNYDNILKRKIWEYVTEFLKLKYKVIGTYRFTEDLVYFIQTERYFNAYEETIANIKIANDIKREVDRHFNVSIKIGIGNCYSGINYMSKSYEEANRAVNSNIGNDIIHINNIINYDKDKSNDNDKVKLFRKVEEYIISNIKEELSLESIAKNFNLSSCYFSRNFKEFIGCNLSDYINSLRIKKAKELLNNNEMSIKEIGYEVGYSDPNYFSKVFKKYEGYSPTEYKFK